MHIAIFLGGEVLFTDLVRKQLTTANIVLAADSGAASALSHGIFVETVIGDFDSIDDATKSTLQHKAQFLSHSSQKDETDTELAIQYAIQKGATKITLIGGTYGDRIDHSIANILLAAKSSVPITFVNGLQKMWALDGPENITVEGRSGDLLSLIPLTTAVEEIVTKHLQYPLKKESLYFGQPRGISNVFISKTVHISWEKGLLLFVHTYKK